MKKTLLFLGLLGLGFTAQAQTPWVLQNTNNPQTPTGFYPRQLHVVSPTVTWGLLLEGVAGAQAGSFAKTSDGGATWTANSINGSSGYAASSIHALDGQTAFVAQFGGNGGGEILKTVNGGNAWTKISTTSMFQAPAGFANWVYFFDANNGVAAGDPANATGGAAGAYWEIYTTTNGGTTWTRVPQSSVPAILDAGEYGLTGGYFALGNTIWTTTLHAVDPNNPTTTGLPARILKSTDRGLTWTASAITPLSGQIDKIAFVDQNNGVAHSGSNLIYTNDGGATWSTRAYTKTRAGSFFFNDIDAVPGTNALISVGVDTTVATGVQYPARNAGSSISTDLGVTWRYIDRASNPGANTRIYQTVDIFSSTVGYVGAFTDASTGAGGFYRYNGNITANRQTQKLTDLSVYPNPSATGVFEVALASGLKNGAQVRVFDALGRTVYHQQLNATSIATQRTTLDLSKEKAGLYTLEVRTEAGVGQQQIVIQ